MDDLPKAVGHLPPYPLGRGIRDDQLRVRMLQLLQTAEFMVKVIIGHAGIVQHVIFIVGLLQFPAQALDLLFLVHGGPPLGMFG